MSDALPADFEGLLRRALAPVDPPESLSARIETTLTELTGIAHEELEGWELKTMRDPRRWAPTVAAVAVGTGAGVGLVLLRMRRSHRKRVAAADDPLQLAESTLRAIAKETRRVLDV